MLNFVFVNYNRAKTRTLRISRRIEGELRRIDICERYCYLLIMSKKEGLRAHFSSLGFDMGNIEINATDSAVIFGTMRTPFLILNPVCVALGAAAAVWSGVKNCAAVHFVCLDATGGLGADTDASNPAPRPSLEEIVV